MSVFLAASLVGWLQILGTVLAVDLLTGGTLVRLPGAVGVCVWGGLILPTVYVIASAIAPFKNAVVLKVRAPGGQAQTHAEAVGSAANMPTAAVRRAAQAERHVQLAAGQRHLRWLQIPFLAGRI
jgi:hypothetical protein